MTNAEFRAAVDAAILEFEAQHDLDLLERLCAMTDEQLAAEAAGGIESIGVGLHIYASAQALLERRRKARAAKDSLA